MNKVAFASACLLGVTLGCNDSKYQTYSKSHHLRTWSATQNSGEAVPEHNFWNEYWESNDSNMAFGDVAKCMTCSAAMAGARKLLEVSWVHKGILGAASTFCDVTGAVGHRFEMCPQFVSQFGEPMFDVIENYILTRDRICNEHLGLCKHPVITELNV